MSASEYEITITSPYRYGMAMTDNYEGWMELTVDDTMSPTGARYAPEVLDAAVRAFCQVLHAESPLRVTKRATASAARPGVFFPEQ